MAGTAVLAANFIVPCKAFGLRREARCFRSGFVVLLLLLGLLMEFEDENEGEEDEGIGDRRDAYPTL